VILPLPTFLTFDGVLLKRERTIAPLPVRNSNTVPVDLGSPPVDKNIRPAILSFYSSTPAEQVDSDSDIYSDDIEDDTVNYSAQVQTTPFPRKEALTRPNSSLFILEPFPGQPMDGSQPKLHKLNSLDFAL
jgi:hypothetical protein